MSIWKTTLLRLQKTILWSLVVYLYRKGFVDYLGLTLERELKGYTTFLELGCGKSSPAVGLIMKLQTVGVDLNVSYLKDNKSKGYFRDYLLADVKYPPFRDNSFDAAVAFDVIEHITKSEGYRLIKNMERIAQKKVIIFTPNGYYPKQHLEDDNLLQAHMSGWTVDEFLSRGYVIFGINGLKALRAEYAQPTIKPAPVGALISKLTYKFVYNSPRIAFQLLCIKHLSRK